MRKRNARAHAAAAVLLFAVAPRVPLQAQNLQTIAFDAIPDQIFGVSPFVIAAQATSRLPVSFISVTPTVCKTASGMVELLSLGTCSITASQGGNASYSAAPSVTRNFTVSMAQLSGSLAAATGSPFTAGQYPLSVVVGDFNGDGIPDLATANYGSNNITVLLGNGSGGFTPAVGSPFSVGSAPASAAVGDFNGDGIPDLAVANSGLNNVTVLLGNGSGGFTPATGSPFSVGRDPYSIAVGDFNGDGIQDLAVANAQSNNVTVLLGNGSGKFTSASGSPFVVGTSPISVVVGDFNGDGIQDLAIANAQSNNVTVMLGNGSGGFTASLGSPFPTGSEPYSLVVGDFNRDGVQDLAIANAQSNNVTVLLGTGLGGFAAAQGSPFGAGSGTAAVVVADFSGDGIQDIAAANASSNSVTLLMGNGSGGFTAAMGRPFPAGLGPESIAVGDFNADGIPDLVTANFGGGTLTVLLGGRVPTNSVLSTTSPLAITFGQSVPLTLTVTDVGGAFSAPSGTATFLDGTAVLSTAVQTVSPYTFSASSLSVGSHSLSATYGGDARSLGSTSNIITIQVDAVVPCDLGQPVIANVADVQSVINQALGVISPVNDLNGDGVVNVVDVQIEINAALGLGCTVQ